MSSRALTALALAALVALAGCGQALAPVSGTVTRTPPASHDWMRFGYDAARSGDNTAEIRLTTATAAGLTRFWQVQLPGVADSSPILLHALPFPGGPRDVLYTTTRDGRLLALDASDGALVWQRQPSGPRITHASPVADPSRGYVYAYGLDGSVHRYNAITGDETASGGWPARVTLMTQTEKESAALNIASGRLYVTTSGYFGDAPPYQGHLVTVDLVTGAERVFNTLCSNLTRLLTASDCASSGSGVWGRGGAVVDPLSGDILIATGNGPYDANHGGADYGDSILKLSPDGVRLLDSFTPDNFQRLSDQDQDLGSMAPTPLPRVAASATPQMLVQGGKDGALRLLNRDDLSGQGGPGHIGGALQTLDAGCAFFSQPAVWTDPVTRQPWVAVASVCALTVYRLATSADGASKLEQVWQDTRAQITTPVYANGALYGAESGALRVWNAASGQRVWGSDQGSAGGGIGAIHWESPIVVDGAVYIADESGALTCYGLKA